MNLLVVHFYSENSEEIARFQHALFKNRKEGKQLLQSAT